MQKLYLNNEEISVSKFSIHRITDIDSTNKFTSVHIYVKDMKEYNEACKFKSIKAGDTILVTNSNALLKLSKKITVKNVTSYDLDVDGYLSDAAGCLNFRFEAEENIEETAKDIANL